MPRARLRKPWITAALALIAAVAIALLARGKEPASAGPVGLFTTLPILWADSPDLAASLNAEGDRHWAREVISARGPVEPLDTLSAAGLAKVRRLILAQPRVLAPQENVVLDDWVRGGGQLLLLADPALTEESAFPLGDPRRPQAVVLLSPILKRWGLELMFDEDQPSGPSERDVMGLAVPVNLPGKFETRGQGNCRLWGDGLAVTCAIGQGRVVAIADAALLEREQGPAGAKAFSWLLDAAFAAS